MPPVGTNQREAHGREPVLEARSDVRIPNLGSNQNSVSAGWSSSNTACSYRSILIELRSNSTARKRTDAKLESADSRSWAVYQLEVTATTPLVRSTLVVIQR